MIRRQSWKADFKDLVEMWTNPENRKLTVAWIVCVLGVVIMGLRASSYSTSFLGIAESRESIINFEFPVTVKRVHALPGQVVSKGELLAELDQPDLDAKIRSTRSQLEKLQAERSLKHEMGRLAANSAPAAVEGDGNFFDPLSSDIKNLELELKILESRERNLYVFSEIAGVVGSVNFKRGERVAPYATILTVSPRSPTRVLGFIHESLHSSVKVGQRMIVSSVADPTKTLEGTVVSVGSRIVELPARMARANVPVWGREVQVELPAFASEANPFLLGEKVQIQPPTFASVGFSTALAEPKVEKAPASAAGPVAAVGEPEIIELPASVKARSKFEPSGILYLPDLRKFAVISDDTDDEDQPYVFLLNPDGTLDTNILLVNGLSKISDVESIASENEKEFYLVSSMTKNSKGNRKKGRTLISRVRREGTLLTAVKTVSLRDSIVAALHSSPLASLRGLQSQFEDDLEIEATLIQGGKFIAALKHPLDEQGRTLVLDLGSISDIMTRGRVLAKDVSIWKTLTFPLFNSKSVHVTDLVPLDEGRFAISTMSKGHGKTGRVWLLDAKSEEPTLLATFPAYTPEGLAFEPKSRELMVVFDEGSDDARFIKIKIPETP